MTSPLCLVPGGAGGRGCCDPVPNKRQRQSRTPQTEVAANPRLARDSSHVSPHASTFLIGTASSSPSPLQLPN